MIVGRVIFPLTTSALSQIFILRLSFFQSLLFRRFVLFLDSVSQITELGSNHTDWSCLWKQACLSSRLYSQAVPVTWKATERASSPRLRGYPRPEALLARPIFSASFALRDGTNDLRKRDPANHKHVPDLPHHFAANDTSCAVPLYGCHHACVALRIMYLPIICWPSDRI